MNYIYNIDNVLKKNIESLRIKPNTQIHICLYQVLFKINSTMENPFLQYLNYELSGGGGKTFLPFFSAF